ncbi:MAG: hypothetical protein GXO68_04600 [Crenarchaeota archaeon]|nr:hypothetical protein [Thermoproteota archaeon]
MKSEKCIIDDVVAIIARLPMTMPGRHYTTSIVEGEVIDRESKEGLQFMVDSGLITIVEAPEVELSIPKRLLSKLSKADVSLLALAVKLREECEEVHIATDDYALQEAAVKLGVKIIPVRYRGARIVRKG